LIAQENYQARTPELREGEKGTGYISIERREARMLEALRAEDSQPEARSNRSSRSIAVQSLFNT
jgi:hypothetical protein